MKLAELARPGLFGSVVTGFPNQVPEAIEPGSTVFLDSP